MRRALALMCFALAGAAAAQIPDGPGFDVITIPGIVNAPGPGCRDEEA